MGLSRLFARPEIPQTTEVVTTSGPVTVGVRVNARARSYRLSVSARGEPVLTMPRAGRWPEARAFLERNSGWLSARLQRIQTPYALAPGAIIPLRGIPHRLVGLDRVRGLVSLVEGGVEPELHVPGGPDHMRRRLIDWLKSEARRDLEIACARHAQNLGVEMAGIVLRDQSTRWGSCSSSGRLNFNWRLVLAPPDVLDYVAAHEVAHILEMNHRPVFWRTVARTCPHYERPKAWLKANGASLMAL
ncbi:M48 family metallopeptidase [Pelagibacterium halotolerans]|nr:SprT family zinc-dependent metalloprotease [Pelagibacterium halotolerans]QJR16996.1 M48 family metallopeptidase [Pelagibacterium halotolerans]